MSIDFMLDKFKNGFERYNNSVIFRRVIDLLYEGKDPYEIIDWLVSNNDEMLDRITDISKNGIKHTIVIETKDEAKKLLEQIKWSNK